MNPRRLLFGLAFLPGLALAQNSQPASPAITDFARDMARKDSNSEGPVASGQPEVTLAATEEGGVVAALLGFKFNRDLTSITAKVASPVEKGAEETELVNLSGLPGGVEATFRLSHAWNSARPAAGSLTVACRAINSILGERLPMLPGSILVQLSAIELMTPENQWKALRHTWHGLTPLPAEPPETPKQVSEVWGKLEPDPEGLHHLLIDHANRLGVTLPPQWAGIEGAVRAELCAEWNAGRASGVLLDPVFETRTADNPTGKNLEIGCLAKACTVANLLDVRQGKANAAAVADLPAREKVESKAAEARDKQRVIAQAELEAAIERARQLRAQGISDDSVAVLVASAELERERLQRETQRLYDETINAAEERRAKAGAEAAAKEGEAVYKALVASAKKLMSPWWDPNLPFLRKPPETVGGTIQCTDLDAAALLATLESAQSGRVFRQLVAATPTLWFLTGEYGVSTQSFKYIADPLALNPETRLVATESDKEYHHGVRAGLSLLWRGSLSTLGLTHKSTWEAKPPAQFCFPRGTDGGLVCATAASGAPTRSETDVFDLQWKRLFTPAFALHAQLFYDQGSEALNPHLLAYFLPQEKKLRGGVDFSYLNKDSAGDDGFKLRLFIGVPFSMGQDG